MLGESKLVSHGRQLFGIDMMSCVLLLASCLWGVEMMTTCQSSHTCIASHSTRPHLVLQPYIFEHKYMYNPVPRQSATFLANPDSSPV
jgi:hypothetical protein